MSPRQRSGSNEDPHHLMDQRKERRMLSNRESARRSRMKKQKRLGDLINQVTQLKAENKQILTKINVVMQNYDAVEAENSILRSQVMELTERLKSMKSTLQFIEDFSGMDMDIPEIPDPLRRPLQLPCPLHPIMSSADMLWC